MKRKNLRLLTIAMLCVAFAAGSAMAKEKELKWKTDGKKVEITGKVVALSARTLVVQPEKDGEEKMFRFATGSMRWQSLMPCEVSDLKTGYWATVRGETSSTGSFITAEQINVVVKKPEGAKPKVSETKLRGTLSAKRGKITIQAGDVVKAEVKIGENTAILLGKKLKRADIGVGDEVTVYGLAIGEDRLASRVILKAKAPKEDEDEDEGEDEDDGNHEGHKDGK
jgi:hypothetical protein